MSDHSPEGIDPRAFAAEQARLGRFFETINKHSKALDLAIEEGFGRVYVLEGRLEHASPDVDAEEVRAAVERLRQALPGLIEGTRAWLRRHGIELS